MKLSDFYVQLDPVGDVHAFTAYLAAPDKDGQDVDLVSVGRVEVDYEKKEVRLYPASTATNVDSIEPEPYLGMVLDQMPIDTMDGNDLNVLVEAPVLRSDTGTDTVSLVELSGVHVGRNSEEVWLLVRPPGEFAAGLLPD
jgi:hypothetical protein